MDPTNTPKRTDTARSGGPPPTRWQRTAFAILPLAAVFLAIEAGLRYFAPEPRAEPTVEDPYIRYDPVLGWRHIPNTEKDAYLPGLPVYFEVTINAQGFRDTRDYPPGKENDAQYRVIALGDSFTFGHGSPTRLSWPARCRDVAPELDVLNFGAQAYGLDQMALLYEMKGADFEADCVVVALIPDDLRRVYLDRWPSGAFRPRLRLTREGRAVPTRQSVPPPVPIGRTVLSPEADGWLVRRSALARFTRSRWRAWQARRDDFRLPAAILMQLIEDAVKRDGRDALVVLLADRETLAGSNDARRAAVIARAACETVGAGFLDTLPAFQEFADGDPTMLDPLFEPGGHYSALGNSFVAQLIAERLLELKRKRDASSAGQVRGAGL